MPGIRAPQVLLIAMLVNSIMDVKCSDGLHAVALKSKDTSKCLGSDGNMSTKALLLVEVGWLTDVSIRSFNVPENVRKNTLKKCIIKNISFFRAVKIYLKADLLGQKNYSG